ncbi:hypothetical protein BDA96_04G172000 [Sorghum bicolor]|uniref:Uncharacterized protein n=1 Tax=Sorghum bicolor TaxID=4558 RepID=A0A921R604_SORBI|nr:hypothetical protein BDA96_04G172000 [Sorghum bicolor]
MTSLFAWMAICYAVMVVQLHFHLKCVGVVEDLLREGGYNCPECLVEKNDGSRNIANPIR